MSKFWDFGESVRDFDVNESVRDYSPFEFKTRVEENLKSMFDQKRLEAFKLALWDPETPFQKQQRLFADFQRMNHGT